MLYAFTTEEGIEKFHQEQRSLIAEGILQDQEADTKGVVYSFFYEDAGYGGRQLAVPPGYPQGYLDDLGIMNNVISSFSIDSYALKVCLYEDPGYGGDTFERVGGTSISNLWFFGWNDRASSLKLYD